MVVIAQNVAQFDETLSALRRLLPQLVGCVVVLVVGYVLARVLVRAVGALLERVGFERAAHRGGVKDALARSGYDARELLTKVVFAGLMLFVLQLAFAVFGPNPVSALLNGVIAYLPRLFVAAVIVVLAAAIGAVVRDIVAALIGSLSYGRMLAVSVYAVILGIGVFAALNQLQIAPTIVNGLFYALLAIVVGVTVVSVGGGGIAPMRQRWERGLTRLDEEAAHIRHAAQQERARREAERDDQQRQAQLEREEQQRSEAAERDEQQRREAAELEEQQRQAQLERDEQQRREAAELEEQQRQAQLERQERERMAVQEFEELRYEQAREQDRYLAYEEGDEQRAPHEVGYFDQHAEYPAEPGDDTFEDERHPGEAESSYPRPDDRRRLRSSRRSSLDQERPPIRYRDPDPQRHVRPYMTTDIDRTHHRADDDESRPAHIDDVDTTRPVHVDDVDATRPVHVDDVDATRPVHIDDVDATRPVHIDETLSIHPDGTRPAHTDDIEPVDVDPDDEETRPIDPGETHPIQRTPWDQPNP